MRRSDLLSFVVHEVTQLGKKINSCGHPGPREVTVWFSQAKLSPPYRDLKPRSQAQGSARGLIGRHERRLWRTVVDHTVFTHSSKYYLNREQESTESEESTAPEDRINAFQKRSLARRSRPGQCGPGELGLPEAMRQGGRDGPSTSQHLGLWSVGSWAFPAELSKGDCAVPGLPPEHSVRGSSRAGVPNLCDLMPDDLRWS